MGDHRVSTRILRLLLFAESSDVAEATVSALRRARYQVRFARATNDAEADQSLGDGDWDLAILQHPFQGRSPEDILEQIARTGRDIPLIIIADPEALEGLTPAMETGARDVVTTDRMARLPAVCGRELAALQVRRENRENERQARLWKRNYSTFLELSRDPVAVVQDGIHLYTNPAYRARFGYEHLEELEGIPILDLVNGKDHDKFKSFLKQQLESETPPSENIYCELAFRDAHGSEFQGRVRTLPAHSDEERAIHILIEEAQETPGDRGRSQEDILTGLANRAAFFTEAESAAEKALNDGATSTLIYVLLDDYPDIKQNVGLAAADLFIAEVGKLIGDLVAEPHVAARYGTASFAVLFHGPLDDAQALAEELRQLVGAFKPQRGQHTIQTSCSIALHLISEQDSALESIVSRTERLTRELSEAGGDRIQAYNPVTSRREELESDKERTNVLTQALQEDRFRLLFQPIISLHGEPGRKYEVLLRLLDADGTEWEPQRFLADAESLGMMPRVDRWVIHNGLKVLARERTNQPGLQLFLKISDASIADTSLGGWILETMRKLQITGDEVAFEIPESAAINQGRQTQRLAAQLREMHCTIALEHFGSGVNSFHHLKQIPAHFLKIDGSFIHEIAANKEKQDTVQEICQTARGMNRMTIAERVEEAQALSVLWRCGVNYVQGHYLQPPHPVMDYEFGGES